MWVWDKDNKSYLDVMCNDHTYTHVFFGLYNKNRLMGQLFKEVYSVVMRPMPQRMYCCLTLLLFL